MTTYHLLAKRWQVILSLIALPISGLAFLAAGFEPRMKHPLLAVLAWFGAMILVVVGSWNFKPKLPKYSRSTALIIILLFEFALLVRAILTTRIPKVLTGDEGSIGLMAIEFIQGTRNNIFTVGWFGFPSLYFFIQSLFVRLLGITTPALRIPSAIVGALTVVAVYLLARVMFNKWIGIFAGIFMLGFHYHIHFSRLGLQNVWDALWYTLVLGFLWFGWTKENRGAFLAAGFGLGFAQYFYVSSRALFLVIPLWLMIVGLMDKERFKRNLPDLIRMGLAASIVLLPLVIFFLRNPNVYFGLMSRSFLFKNGVLTTINESGHSAWLYTLHQLSIGFMGFIIEPIRYIYQPGSAMLRPVAAFLFGLGLILLLFRIRDSGTWLLLLWLAVIIPIVGLSDFSPCSQRYIATAPAAAILVGFGLGRLIELAKSLTSLSQRNLNWIGLLIISLLCLSDLNFYFMEYTPISDDGNASMIAQTLADYLQDKDENWTVLMLGEGPNIEYTHFPSLSYLVTNVPMVEINHPWGSDENPEVPVDHLIFVVLANRLSELDAIRANYPGGRSRRVIHPKGHLLYVIYEVESPQTPH